MGDCGCGVCVRTYSFICVLIGAQSDKMTDNQSNKQTNIHPHPHTPTSTPPHTITHSHGRDKQTCRQTKAVGDGSQQTTLSKVNSTNKSHAPKHSAVSKNSEAAIFSINLQIKY